MSEVRDQTGTRRDFLYVTTAAVGAVTVGGAVWPLINQMNPSADVKAFKSVAHFRSLGATSYFVTSAKNLLQPNEML